MVFLWHFWLSVVGTRSHFWFRKVRKDGYNTVQETILVNRVEKRNCTIRSQLCDILPPHCIDLILLFEESPEDDEKKKLKDEAKCAQSVPILQNFPKKFETNFFQPTFQNFLVSVEFFILVFQRACRLSSKTLFIIIFGTNFICIRNGTNFFLQNFEPKKFLQV